ncbi:MAG: V4R domain-containing protein [Gemmatimonadales bacterium]|jgi:predicted hydrocarbon binding protein
MTDIPLSASSLVALSPRALHALRDRVGAQALQEAGYAAGEATFRAFSAWLPQAAGVDQPSELAAPRLAEVLSQFFVSLGWGAVHVTSIGEAAVAVDAPAWAEATPEAQLQYPSCFFTSGLLADFMGRLAEASLAVMEVECRSKGDARCRWLVGAPETLTALYEHMTQGADYLTILGAG